MQIIINISAHTRTFELVATTTISLANVKVFLERKAQAIQTPSAERFNYSRMQFFFSAMP